MSANEVMQCEKHAKKEEALAKLREGLKFDEVAKEFSEDKARQGRFNHCRLAISLFWFNCSQEVHLAGRRGEA
jgi:hypothetical protein